MPVWLMPIISFVGQRALHFFIYAALGLAAWGVYNKVFVTPTSSTSTKVEAGGKQVNIYHQGEDANKISLFNFGCSNLKVDTYWKRNKLPTNTKEK